MTNIRALAIGVAMALVSSSVTAAVDCNRTFGQTDQALPPEYAVCAPAQAPFANQPLAPTDTAFVNVLFAPAGVTAGINTHVLNNFPASLTPRGLTNPSLFSLDLSADGTTLFGAVVSNAATPPANNRTLGTINQTTGAYTVVAPLTGLVDQANESASDLSIHPSTNVAYLLTNAGMAPAVTSRLYTVNLATGALTLVGAQANNPSFVIDMAVNCQGQIFGHRFNGTTGQPSDLVSINPTNGAVTLVGSTGFPANFAQGMDFDAEANTLYMWQFEGNAPANVVIRYGTVNTTTGALTPIFTSAVGAGIEIEGAIRSACPAGATAPTFGYTPAPGSTVTATGGTTVGSTGNLSIAPSVATPGTGTGAPATTTLTCTAPIAPFAGFGQTITAVGTGAITGGPLAGTCTLGATAATQTLICNENRGGTTPTTRTWTLSCPAGTAPPAPTVAVNATSTWSLIALMLGLFGFAAVMVRRQG